jgi:hypothetical protein
MHEYLRLHQPELLVSLVGNKVAGDLADNLGQAIDAFRTTFTPSRVEAPVVDERNEGWDVMAADDASA